MNRRTSPLVAAITLLVLLLPIASAATTNFFSPSGRIAPIQVLGRRRFHALVTTSGGSQLATKTAAGGWVLLTGQPGTAYYLATGVAGVNPPSAWGASRVYVITASSNQLWELNYDSGSPAFRPVTGSNGPSLGSSPAIDVVFDSANGGTNGGRVWIGVRASNGHVWTCRIDTRLSVCAWEDESCYPAGPNCATPRLASTSSPIALNPISLEGYGFSPLEVYMLGNDTRDSAWRFRWDSGVWDQLGQPTLPTSADTVALQVATWGGATRVALMGWDRDPSHGDTIQVVRNTGGTGPAAWTWTNVTPTSYQNDVAFVRNSLSFATDLATRDQVWFLDQFESQLIECWLSGPTATPSCTTSYAWNQPSEQRVSFDAIGGAVAATLDNAYVGGSLGFSATYLYHAGTTVPGMGWENYLSYRDPFTVFGNYNTQQMEYDVAEFDGTVVASAIDLTNARVALWRSTDDGNSWSAPWNSWPWGGGNANVAIDVTGNEYATEAGGVSISLVRWNSPTSTWTPSAGYTIPATATRFLDRGWLAADPSRANFLYVTWADLNGRGSMAYCNGGGDCAAGNWCQAFDLTATIGSNCSLSNGGVGCQVGSSAAYGGLVWLMAGDDNGCASDPNGLSRIGIRYLTNRTSLGTGCATPTWSAPYCLYFRAREFNSSQLHGGTNSPALARRWQANLVVAQDTGMPAVSVMQLTDVSTGNSCANSGLPCRTDQRMAYLNNSGQWCGVYCFAGAATPVNMLWINRDNTWPFSWVDHVYGSVTTFDGQGFGLSWMDFREDPTNDVSYHLYSASIRPGGSVSEVRWNTSTVGNFIPNGNNTYGDLNTGGSARLHTHSVLPFTTIVGGFQVNESLASLWAPDSPLQ